MTRSVILALGVAALAGCVGSQKDLGTTCGPSVAPAVAPYVFVDGEVNTPSRCAWSTGLTLMDAIQMAGGFTDRAKRSTVSVRHNNGAVDKVDCTQRHAQQWGTILLAPGDVVGVPSRAGFRIQSPPPNKVTGASAGGRHHLPVRTRLVARIAQFMC